MKNKAIRALALLAATAAVSVALPTGAAFAADAHDTDTVAMPGGSGSITCTTDYDISTSGASVKPVKTYCTNRTNRYVNWKWIGHLAYSSYHGDWVIIDSYNFNTTQMAPGGRYDFTWPSDASWRPKSERPKVESYFTSGTGGLNQATVLNSLS